jgi:NADPH:quinone reductase-like Zn-dependent oxidoreductase
LTTEALIPGKMQNFGLLRADTGKAVVQAIPIPELRPGYILVKTFAVALNPTDWTSLDAVGKPGTIVGCDYAGIVEQVDSGGSNRFKKGDRIAGFAHGGMSQRSVQNLTIAIQ